MKHISIYIGLLAMLAFPRDPQAKLFNGEEFFLPNGMQVIVIPNHRVPVVKHMVWYKSGAVDEKPGKGGSAHLLEHLMFRGTPVIPGNRLNELLEANGAESNAFTSQDMTAYHQFLDISRLELAMFLEADRMKNLEIGDEDFELERSIVFQERKQRVDDNPAAVFGEYLQRALWQNHPYSRPVSGTEDEILSLNKKDVEDFYKLHYAPNNAILVLSGDIDPAMARRLADRYYGKLKRGLPVERPSLPQLRENFKSTVEMALPQVSSPRVVKFYAAPSYNQGRGAIYNLEVLADYMGLSLIHI